MDTFSTKAKVLRHRKQLLTRLLLISAGGWGPVTGQYREATKTVSWEGPERSRACGGGRAMMASKA